MYLLEKHTLTAHIFLFQGICFIRTSRPESAVIYSPDEKFEVGVAKVMISASGYTHKSTKDGSNKEMSVSPGGPPVW